MDSPVFTFEGIAIHPSHNLFIPSPSPESEEELSRFSTLALDHSPELPSPSSFRSNGSSSSLSSSLSSTYGADTNFFFPSHSPSDSDDEVSSPLSSGYTTPTRESPSPLKKHTVLPSSLDFSAPSRRRASTPTPSNRSHPYSRPSTPPTGGEDCSPALVFPPRRPTSGSGSTSMQRAYSTPVLTQKQMDERQTLSSALHLGAVEQSPELGMGGLMQRSKTMGVGLGWSDRSASSPNIPFSSYSMASSSSSIPAVAFTSAGGEATTGLGLHVPFSFSLPQNWGETLPPSSSSIEPSAPRLTYPYNIHEKATPPRFNRAQSYSGASPVAGGGGAPRSRLRALTPILPTSLPSIPGSPEQPAARPTNRTQRGLSF